MLFHVKLVDCKIDVFVFPINIWFAVKVVPIPPRAIGIVPKTALDTFNELIPVPPPIN